MNFLSLEYFLAVAEELNITKAAERLYISQQSLSNSIIKLEKSLGIKLFNRTPVFSLTYAGTRLEAAASQIMDIKRQIESEIDDISHNRRGELKIGVSHTRGCAILPIILPAYRETHPLVEISLIEGNSEMLEHSLHHGMIDLMIGFTPILLESAETVELINDRLFLVVPKHITQSLFGDKTDFMRGKFSEAADITAFKDCPFLMLKKGNRIRSIMDLFFSTKDIHPEIALETENIETAFALAEKGMGITIYPEMFLKSIHTTGNNENVDLFPLKNSSAICTLAIGYNRKRYLSAAAREFVELSVQIFKNKELSETDA